MKTKTVSLALDTLPPLTDEQLKAATPGRFYRPIKRRIAARVDADVLE